MMLYIFHATSCLTSFNIVVTRMRVLADMESRNSHLVSMGFFSPVLFICAIWSHWLLINTLLANSMCISMKSSRAPANINISVMVSVKNVAYFGSSVTFTRRTPSAPGNSPLAHIHAPLLSSALFSSLLCFFFQVTFSFPFFSSYLNERDTFCEAACASSQNTFALVYVRLCVTPLHFLMHIYFFRYRRVQRFVFLSSLVSSLFIIFLFISGNKIWAEVCKNSQRLINFFYWSFTAL